MNPSAPTHPVELHAAAVPQSQIPSVYDRIAPVYDFWGWFTERRARARALELAAVRDGESVLEVAVGTGLAFRELVRANPHGRTHGIDISPGMLARAERKVRPLPGQWHLGHGSALALPFPDAAFDLLLNNYMFDLLSVPEIARALVEFRRVLRPGGRLVLVNMTHGESAATRLFEAAYRLSPRLMGGCRGVRLAPLLARFGFCLSRPREFIAESFFPSEVLLAERPEAPDPQSGDDPPRSAASAQ